MQPMAITSGLDPIRTELEERQADDILLNNKQSSNQQQPETISPTYSASSSMSSSVNDDSLRSVPNTISSSSSFANPPKMRSNSNSSSTTSLNTNSRLSVASMPEHLLDHSHLKPGKDASLLTYTQTLNMYKQNVSKTNNPQMQVDFALFMVEAANQLPDDDASKKGYLSEAEKLLKQLAAKGHADAQYQLGKLYTAGLFNKKGKPDYDRAFTLFVQASKHFHTDASLRAGECYEEGLGCRQNGDKAQLFYKKAASLGHPAAMNRLAFAYKNGELGVSKNPKEAVKWLSLAAEAATPEYPEALYELAMLHTTGFENVVYVDIEYSVRLLNQAAEMGHGPAAFKLGECYEYGKLNCQPDPALSIHYYTIAAEKGNRDACFALTAWYLVGSPGVLPQSDENAYTWARRAAEMDLPKAQYAIGYFTEAGIGCEKNPTEAQMWYQKAAKNGDKRAIQKLHGKVVTQDIKPTGKKRSSSQEDCVIM